MSRPRSAARRPPMRKSALRAPRIFRFSVWRRPPASTAPAPRIGSAAPSRLWSVGPAAGILTVFDAGRHRAQSAQAKAVYDEQVADYRNTVLTAYREVEDNLAALRQLQQESVSEAAAVTATATALAAGPISVQGGPGDLSRSRHRGEHRAAGATRERIDSTEAPERECASGQGTRRWLA